MSTAGYRAILERLNDLDGPPDAIEAFRAIVQEQLDAGMPQREERVQFASNQLASRTPRAEICRQLCDRFGVGKSQAYRDITDALNLSQRMGNF